MSRGGTDLERGYGDVRPWRPPFHTSPAARKGPISSKRVSSQGPLLRKFGNFSLNSLNFHPNFTSQAPKFGNFPLTSPPFQRQMSVRKPHTSEIRAATPTWKKVECPPPPGYMYYVQAIKTLLKSYKFSLNPHHNHSYPLTKSFTPNLVCGPIPLQWHHQQQDKKHLNVLLWFKLLIPVPLLSPQLKHKMFSTVFKQPIIHVNEDPLLIFTKLNR